MPVFTRSAAALGALRENIGFTTPLRKYARAFGHGERAEEVELDVRTSWQDACDGIAYANTARVTNAVFAMLQRMTPSNASTGGAHFSTFRQEVVVALDRAFAIVEGASLPGQASRAAANKIVSSARVRLAQARLKGGRWCSCRAACR
jgi:hypothetical protein